MGLLDKLKFWKKEEEFDFDQLVDKSMGSTAPNEDLGSKNLPQDKTFFPE